MTSTRGFAFNKAGSPKTTLEQKAPGCGCWKLYPTFLVKIYLDPATSAPQISKETRGWARRTNNSPDKYCRPVAASRSIISGMWEVLYVIQSSDRSTGRRCSALFCQSSSTSIHTNIIAAFLFSATIIPTFNLVASFRRSPTQNPDASQHSLGRLETGRSLPPSDKATLDQVTWTFSRGSTVSSPLVEVLQVVRHSQSDLLQSVATSFCTQDQAPGEAYAVLATR